MQSMVLSACKAGDKIILPRNVHKSVINALVLCGATPVYVNPEVDKKLGISLGMELPEVERAVKENPDATCILVNNPTYYGICSDLRSIVKLAHDHGMLALVDEAHGTHLYFGPDVASQKPVINLVIVDLPEPEGPTKAVIVPGCIVRLI